MQKQIKELEQKALNIALIISEYKRENYTFMMYSNEKLFVVFMINERPIEVEISFDDLEKDEAVLKKEYETFLKLKEKFKNKT